MKIVAYTALHYGREYLAYAIRSVIDAIDEYHVLYSVTGSHGHNTDIPCPEKHDELYTIARASAGDKLRWHDGTWAQEGHQRDSIYQYAPDADGILVLDSDEIWSAETLQTALNTVPNATARFYRAPMIHYWRSFYRAVLHDPSFPTRLICPHVDTGDATLDTTGVIHHMGYAQTPAIVEYKQLTHGHRNEWRKDIDWFHDRYLANAQQDCHPVGSVYWNPEDIDPMTAMPAFMRTHPYFHEALIEEFRCN